MPAMFFLRNMIFVDFSIFVVFVLHLKYLFRIHTWLTSIKSAILASEKNMRLVQRFLNVYEEMKFHNRNNEDQMEQIQNHLETAIVNLNTIYQGSPYKSTSKMK